MATIKEMNDASQKNLKGLLYGVAYGLLARAVFAIEFDWNILSTNGLMTFSFLFLVPFVIGLITAYHRQPTSKVFTLVGIAMPLSSVLGIILISLLAGQEGIICALMAIPVFAVMALLGSFVGVKLFYNNPNKMTISFVLFIPFLVAPVETYFGLNQEIFTEVTSIQIEATEEVIWKHITRVEPISEEENSISLFQILGFPRPVEAVLDTVAVGGVRIAHFDRGLFFTETVTEMVPNKTLAFTIKADPDAIPPTALDEHVLVGGRYFDILNGKYELEKITSYQYKLTLSSQFRLSTNFNFYSGLWSKLIMRDIQNNILHIIRERTKQQP